MAATLTGFCPVLSFGNVKLSPSFNCMTSITTHL